MITPNPIKFPDAFDQIPPEFRSTVQTAFILGALEYGQQVNARLNTDMNILGAIIMNGKLGEEFNNLGKTK